MCGIKGGSIRKKSLQCRKRQDAGTALEGFFVAFGVQNMKAIFGYATVILGKSWMFKFCVANQKEMIYNGEGKRGKNSKKGVVKLWKLRKFLAKDK